MPKRVLDVGNCSMDHAAIQSMLMDFFQADVLQAHGPMDALAAVRAGDIDLVVVNRKLDQDYSDGLEVIKLLKSTPDTAHIPVMLVTNHAEYHQEAQACGAERGFGKKTLRSEETRQLLMPYLG